ncbi:DUF262 domain-containing protein, partial [bacterium]|nr:DUF262 domain-containing protein [bacterium]
DFNFIIDGQQRITTLIIFLVAIRNYLYSINDEDKAKEIHNDFIEKGGILKNKVSKLIVNKYDNSFFDKYIIKHNPTILNLKLNELSTGQKNLFSAYKYFFDKIKSLETFDAIRNYLEIVLDRTYLISIEVYDEEQAYLVFETLNARGLDLSASELIKNNIYAQAAKLNILDDISSSWDSINIRLGNQNIISFLKNYVTTHNKEGIVREKQLFKHLKNLTKLSSDVKSFVEELEIEAEVYNNLIEPTFDYWKNNDLVETINNIKLLNLKTCYPLLLSIGVNNKIKIQDKLSICKLIENLGFKYNVILNLNPNELEKKYATWSFKVRNNLIKIKELKKEISSFFPKVEDFVEAFSEKQIKQNKIA